MYIPINNIKGEKRIDLPYSIDSDTRRAERASNLTFSKCLHLVDLNNPRILMTHDKMAVTANIRAYTVQSFQTSITVSSVVYMY